MEMIFVIICLISLFGEILCICTVDSPSEQNYTKYLDPLKATTLTIEDAAHEYTYMIRFCEGIDAKGSKSAGVVQTGLGDKANESHIIGRITTTDIKVGSDWILLTYQNGDQYGSHCGQEARKAHIMLICNTKQLVKSYQVIEENSEKHSSCSYIFEVSTSAACTVSKVSPIEGLSIGSVLVILFLSIVAAYIILGFLYKRFLVGAKGIEQFPNIVFWRNFGNLVADGCDLFFRTKSAQESRSYKGLGDDQLGFDEDEERDDHMLPM